MRQKEPSHGSGKEHKGEQKLESGSFHS
jgi:hypothetical protein